MAGVFVPLGYSLWFGLHLAVVPLLPDWRLIALTLVSLAYWIDAVLGNSIVFSFVAGAVALGGSRWGSLAYLALFVLIPRPVQAPLALFILWRKPDMRIPFGIMFATIF